MHKKFLQVGNPMIGDTVYFLAEDCSNCDDFCEKYDEDEETISEYEETIIIPEGNYDNETLENYLNSTYFYETSEDTPLQHIKFQVKIYEI